MRNDKHWISYAVTVDGQLWSWKGERCSADKDVRQDPCLSSKYYPPHSKGKFEIHAALFFLGDAGSPTETGAESWYRQWPPHPERAGGFSPDIREEPTHPLRSASFECEVRQAESIHGGTIPYWARRATP